MAALSEVADVTREDGMAILCAVGEGLQNDPAFVGRLLDAVGGVPVRMLSQAAARRNITLVINENDLVPALQRVHERFFGPVPTAPCLPVRRDRRRGMTNLLIVGHGRMGKLVESLAAVARLPSGRRRGEWIRVPTHSRRRTSVPSTSRLISPWPAPFGRTCEAMAARRWNVVIGTTGWQQDEAACRAIAEKAGIGVMASANFSIGMQVFRQIVEEASRRFAKLNDVGAWIHESHHSAKKDAPSGTAILLQVGDGVGGLHAADRHLVDPRGIDSRHPSRRIRRAG